MTKMTKQMTGSLRAALRVAAVAGALCIAATSAHAGTIVFTNGPGPGSQQNYVLGMDFDVINAVTVTQLGAFDSGGNGFAGSITVGIFDLTTLTLVAPSVTLTGTGGTLVGGSRFVAVTPFVLGPGNYSIVAAGFTGLDLSGNTGGSPVGVTSFNNVGGNLSLVGLGGRWDNGNTFGLPTAFSGGYTQGDPVFQAGTFAVPDGGSAAILLGLGVLAVGWARRRFNS